jgi:hypothetical protein
MRVCVLSVVCVGACLYVRVCVCACACAFSYDKWYRPRLPGYGMISGTRDRAGTRTKKSARAHARAHARTRTAGVPDDAAQWRALRQYVRSAQQGNVESEIKVDRCNGRAAPRCVCVCVATDRAAAVQVGDYHYYGWGTRVHHKKAVAHYRTAAESRDAQAYFNLAYVLRARARLGVCACSCARARACSCVCGSRNPNAACCNAVKHVAM